MSRFFTLFLFLTFSFSFQLQAKENKKQPMILEKQTYNKIIPEYDKKQLQRGFQIYNEICSSCHSMNDLRYRDLEQIGIEWSFIKTLASKYEYPNGYDEEGEPKKRKGMPTDKFAKPYPNEKYARFVNFGALPPDLSIIAKARKHGINYIYSFISGFTEEPINGENIPADLVYNPYFEGKGTNMPPPLAEGVIKYKDGTKASIEQMAKDITAFLKWSSDPYLEKRFSLGWKVTLYFLCLTIILFLLKKSIWKDL